VCVQSPCAHHVSPRAEQIVNVRRSREPACRANSAWRKPSIRCAARPHFFSKNEASGERRPRRTRRSHEYQRELRKPSAHAAVFCSPCAHHAPNFTAQALSAEAAAYDSGGRGVRYAQTTVNAHHVSYACMQPPCARLVRIMSPTILPRPRRTLRSNNFQRASRKLSVHAVTLCSPGAHHISHYKSQAMRAEAAAYATHARLSTLIT
jgi:hypothetical protein